MVVKPAAPALAGVVINPAQVRAFGRATGRLNAGLIAHFAKAIRPKLRPVASEQAQVLAELVTRRQQVIEMIDRESNRRRTARSPKLLRGIECSLAALQAALTELDREIDDQIRAPPAWFEMAGRLARTTVTQAFRGYSTAGSATV